MQTLNLTKKYEKYSEYKDSGVEWLGKIPKEWKVGKVKEVFNLLKERSFNNSESEILSLTLSGIKTRDVSNNEGQIAASYEGYRKIIKGDIVLNPMDLVRGFVDASKYEGIISPAYSTLRKKDKKTNSQYYNYFFQKHYFEGIFHPFGNGVSVDHRWTLKDDTLVNFPILIISPEQQTKIADYIDDKTIMIEEIIEKKEKQIELLKEEIVSIAMNEQIKGKGKIIRIKNLFKLSENPINIEDYSEYTALGLYNRGRGLFHKDFQLGKDIKESDFYKVISRDLIISGQFAWEGAVAFAGEDESGCVVSHRYYLLRDGIVKTEYLLALLMTKFGDHILNESSRGSAGRNKPLNIKILLLEKIRVPSKDIEEKIESLLIKMNLVRKNIKTSIKLLEEYKFSLISNVVTGKVKV
ncbi:MAG: restriction endonuclease subunit S [Candidatus Paceibacterota bacterium]|jgi:type I restriction enzyme S subunit